VRPYETWDVEFWSVFQVIDAVVSVVDAVIEERVGAFPEGVDVPVVVAVVMVENVWSGEFTILPDASVDSTWK